MLLFSLKTGTLSVAFPGNIDIFSTPCSIHNVVLDVHKCSFWWSQMKVCYIYQCVPHLPMWCSIKLFTRFLFFFNQTLGLLLSCHDEHPQRYSVFYPFILWFDHFSPQCRFSSIRIHPLYVSAVTFTWVEIEMIKFYYKPTQYTTIKLYQRAIDCWSLIGQSVLSNVL